MNADEDEGTAVSDPTDAEELALRKSLKLERYAEIMAHVVHFGTERTEEVVRRFGFSAEAWRAVDRAWSRELSLGIKRQQHDQGLRFSATFHKRRQRLSLEQPVIDAIGDAPAAPVAAAPAPVAAKPAAEAVALPSFMVASAAPKASVAAVATGGAAPAPPVAAPPPTVPIPVVRMAAEEPLPFVERAPAAALESALAHAQAVQGPKVTKPVGPGETAPMNERLAALARQHLPFGSPAAGAPPRMEAAAAPEPAESADALGPPESRLPLSMEQHASLTVELAAYPDRSAAILQRYGMRPEQWSSVNAGWLARIEDDPHLRAAWEQASAQYRAWLIKNQAP